VSDDLSDVIADLATGTYSVSRPAARTYNATTGELTSPGSPTTFSVLGCLQPPTPRQLQRLPEGRRERAIWALWTATPLRNGDVITIAGENFEVDGLDDWTAAGNFCKALALKKDS
jgi:hypothetical protein